MNSVHDLAVLVDQAIEDLPCNAIDEALEMIRSTDSFNIRNGEIQ